MDTKRIWTRIPIFGDGTVKLPADLLEHIGFASGEEGAIYVAKSMTTRRGELHPEAPSVFLVSARALEALAPEELGAATGQ